MRSGETPVFENRLLIERIPCGDVSPAFESNRIILEFPLFDNDPVVSTIKSIFNNFYFQ